jgi:uncharacterized membrane protein YozB (DUF420 family)
MLGVVSTRNHRFFVGMALAIVATVLVGFAPSYYLKAFSDTAPLSGLVHLHGLVATGWILLFVTQTWLIARHRTALHRRLGLAAFALVPLFSAVSLATAIAAARRDVAIDAEDALSFLGIGVSDAVVFFVLASAGILLRRRTETHKRLMLLATICILDAAIGRWPSTIFSGSAVAYSVWTDVFVLMCVVHDLISRGRVHQAYLLGGLLIVAAHVARITLAHTATWLAIARALV